MFEFCIRKMLRNKWMVACLLVGFVISTAVMTCIPIYTGSILQRMLVKDLEAEQTESGLYPGNYSITLQTTQQNMSEQEKRELPERFRALEQELNEEELASLGIPLTASSRQYQYLDSYVQVGLNTEKTHKEAMALTGREDFFDHCKLVAGEFPSTEAQDGVIEVMLTEEGLNFYQTALGKTLELCPYEEGGPSQQLRVVGVYTYQEMDDLYWYYPINNYKRTAMMDYGLFQELFGTQGEMLIDNARWLSTFDYHEVQMNQVPELFNRLSLLEQKLNGIGSVSFPADSVFAEYQQRQEELNLTLQALLAPVVLMLFFYLFMVSSLIMEHEKNDISLLKSRGANNLQVLSEALMKNGLVALAAVIPGTLCGLLICKVLGLSNGFLELVDRKNMEVSFQLDSEYLLGLLAVFLIGFLAVIIPAIQASRLSIVEYKRKKVKFFKGAWWKKLGIDVILIALSAYGLYNYQNMSESLAESDTGMLAHIDPSLFLITAVLILGLGLLFVRLFPYLVRLVFAIGKRRWPPALYASFLSVSRSRGKDQFIILFLILTVALAMFHATAARTLNSFMEDRVLYAAGAGLTLELNFPYQESYYKLEEGESSEEGKLVPASKDDEGYLIRSVTYQDIPFQPFLEVKGVETGTKVFRKESVTLSNDSDTWSRVQLMGVIPHEFADVLWMRDDLLPHHINEYLNLLAADPRYVLLSTSMQEEGLKVGDEIEISWQNQPYTMDCVVAGFVDYWPSFNPVRSGDDSGLSSETPELVVANYNLIQAQMRFEPYEVWLDLDDTTLHADIYQDIQEQKLPVSGIVDASQNLIQVKNDPMLQGINGSLTLSFVVTLTVSLIGFLIFWILNLKERTLQFGVLRAMGLSKRSLLVMLGMEQLMITGGSVLAGILIGLLVNRLTVPMLQYLYAPSEQVPPFTVYMEASDYVKIFVVIGLMLLIGIGVLLYMVNRIKIDQALKLGED